MISIIKKKNPNEFDRVCFLPPETFAQNCILQGKLYHMKQTDKRHMNSITALLCQREGRQQGVRNTLESECTEPWRSQCTGWSERFLWGSASLQVHLVKQRYAVFLVFASVHQKHSKVLDRNGINVCVLYYQERKTSSGG